MADLAHVGRLLDSQHSLAAPIAWWFAHGQEEPRNTDLFWVYLVLSFGFWIGHRLSSSYLAYCTSAYRPLLRTQRVRFVWVPLGIGIAVFAILLPADDMLPWSRATRSMYLIIIDYGLITYHFASQHFGFLRLYRVRAGQARSERGRRIDRVYTLVIGGLMVFVAESIAGTVFFHYALDRAVFRFSDPEVRHAARGLFEARRRSEK